jgi:hypothetical protein
MRYATRTDHRDSGQPEQKIQPFQNDLQTKTGTNLVSQSTTERYATLSRNSITTELANFSARYSASWLSRSAGQDSFHPMANGAAMRRGKRPKQARNGIKGCKAVGGGMCLRRLNRCTAATTARACDA